MFPSKHMAMAALCFGRPPNQTTAQMTKKPAAGAAHWHRVLFVAVVIAAAPVLHVHGPSAQALGFGFPQALAKDGSSDGGGSGSGSGSGKGSDDGGGSSSGSGSESGSGSGSGSESHGGGEASKGSSTDDGASGDEKSAADGASDDREAKVEIRGERVIISYADGFREEISRGILVLKDPQGRTIVKRPATAADKARLKALEN